MAETGNLVKLSTEIETGIAQEKCRKCGCMKGALEEILESLDTDTAKEALELKSKVKSWLGKTEESLYT